MHKRQNRTMPRLLVVFVFASILSAQTPAETSDPLGRNTPQSSVFQFLEACHAGQYAKAARYLDLRRKSTTERAKDGPELAMQLEDVLDDTPFDIGSLSTDPEGDPGDDLNVDLDQLISVKVDEQSVDLKLERVELRPGFKIWLVSADSVDRIPKAHQAVKETSLEKRLPQPLVTTELFNTPVWRWMALVLMAVALWFVTGLAVWALHWMTKPIFDAGRFRGAARLALAIAGLRIAMEFAPPATLSRTYLERAMVLVFVLAIARAGGVAIDMIAQRWHSHLDPRVQAVSFSVLPLGSQMVKLSLYLVAILGALSAWGYNTTTILAGLGVGGLAIALAAQKTIENLFGGISVIGDRPVLVGDVCRFGDRTGTVMHIGLRSTSIRTPERTIVSVPNAQFSSMTLENISGRDKILFNQKLSLRRDTTSDQLLEVLAALGEILNTHPKVEVGAIPVRFVGVGPYSLDIEIAGYVTTSNYDEFLNLQQELLIRMLQAVEAAGAALAVPLQESFQPIKSSKAVG